MATWKMSLVFNMGVNGWVESYYKDGPESPFSVINTVTGQTGFLLARRNLLHSAAKITAIMVRDVGRPRDGIVHALDAGAGVGLFPTAIQDPQQQANTANAAVNFRVYAGDTTWRTLLMRGLGKAVFGPDGRLSNGPWNALATAYTTAVLASGWQIRKSTVGATVGLTDLRFSNGSINQLTTDAPVPGALVTSTLLVRLAEGITNVNGRYRILEILPGNKYTVVKRQKRSTGELELGTGRVAAIAFTYPNITRIVPVDSTSRDTGRPIDASRGRALVRRD